MKERQSFNYFYPYLFLELRKKNDKIKKFTIKRVGSPMNEMKRSKIDSIIESRLNNVRSKHDTLLKDAINALEMLKMSEQDLLMMKRKRDRVVNSNKDSLPDVLKTRNKKLIPILAKKDVSFYDV